MSYKAEFLQQYFRQHRWRIKRRKEIDNPDAKDLATWSEATLQDSIRSSYEASLQNRQQLINTPVENIAELLQQEPLNRKYKPSLYDLLAHRALDYFTDSSNFPDVNPAAEYLFDASELFGSTAQFLKLKFPKEAQQTSEVYVLKIMQQLEDLHSEEKDPTALVYAQLQRLELCKFTHPKMGKIHAGPGQAFATVRRHTGNSPAALHPRPMPILNVLN